MFAICLFQPCISTRNVAPVFLAWRACKGVALRYNRHSGLYIPYSTPHACFNIIQSVLHALHPALHIGQFARYCAHSLRAKLHLLGSALYIPPTRPCARHAMSRFKAGSVLHKLRSALLTSHSLHSTLHTSRFNIPCFTRDTPDCTFHASNFAFDAQRFAPRMPHCTIYTRALTPALHSAF